MSIFVTSIGKVFTMRPLGENGSVGLPEGKCVHNMPSRRKTETLSVYQKEIWSALGYEEENMLFRRKCAHLVSA